MRDSPFAVAYYNSPFNVGPLTYADQVHSPPQLKGKKLLILLGGEDISPGIYKQDPVRTSAGKEPSRRDQIEINLVKAAIQEEIPMLGICRGAQLLCALGGGSLYQHVNNHVGRDHPVVVKGKEYWTNSCHHQMMIPTEDMQVLGYSPCLSPEKWLDQCDPVEVEEEEPELVYMPKMKALAVQGHPEWLSWYNHDYVQLIRNLTGELLHVEI
jgi:anthranilate/para-aminobenzoate synthase component II